MWSNWIPEYKLSNGRFFMAYRNNIPISGQGGPQHYLYSNGLALLTKALKRETKVQLWSCQTDVILGIYRNGLKTFLYTQPEEWMRFKQFSLKERKSKLRKFPSLKGNKISENWIIERRASRCTLEVKWHLRVEKETRST